MGQHTVLDALHVVDEELALDAVVDDDAEVDQVKDDKAQDTECLQRVAPPTVRRGHTQTEGGERGREGGTEGRRGVRKKRKEGRWWNGLMRERKSLSCEMAHQCHSYMN